MPIAKDHNANSRQRKHAADRAYERKLAERIRLKKLYDHELADPEYYASIERELRTALREFTLEVAPDVTTARWRTQSGQPCVFRGAVRADVLLRLWRDELPTEF